MPDHANGTEKNDIATDIFAYYPLTLVIIGTLFNLFTFFILCRSNFSDAKKRPTLYYMRAIAIFDILMLYGWNLDHYILPIHGFKLHTYSVGWCKFTAFLNYFAPQGSAWLRVFVSLDRYLSLSRLHRTWFSNSKNVLILISISLSILALLNFHFFPFGCFVQIDGSINTNSKLYRIYPLWDYINLALYNCIPFILMTAFNSGVIYHLIRLRRTSSIQNSQIHHRSISITLVLTTFLFSIMTIPATVGYAFFMKTTYYLILQILDSILYTYHVSSFPIYFITLDEFRRDVTALVKYDCSRRRVVSNDTQTITQTRMQTQMA